jgi:hypothetical protein
VIENGLVVPTDDQINAIVSAIHTRVYNAIKDKVSWWSKLWDNQDDFIGHSHALFVGKDLAEPATPTVQDFLAPIDADAFEIVINWNTYPISASLVKVGHNHYEFIRPQLTLSKAPGVCVDRVKALDAAAGTLRKLRDKRNKLKARLAETEGEQQSIRKEIANLKSSEIPEAERALNAAARALRDCHILTSIVGNKPID